MFEHEVQVRVRYSETDQMGFVYYGNYASYFEVARVEALRKTGFAYKLLEESGILLPVLENWSKYILPAHYDDLLRIKVMVKNLPGVRFVFDYEIYNEEDTLIHIGKTTLVFIKKDSGKPCMPPDDLIAHLKPYFE